MTEQKGTSNLFLTVPPHIHSGGSIPRIMWSIAAALLPVIIYSSYLYGLIALGSILVSASSAVLAELMYSLLFKKPVTIKDGSAVVAGLLVALSIPAGAPLWLPALGSLFAVIASRLIFTGLGRNVFNPVLCSRVVMAALWPVYLKSGWNIFSENHMAAFQGEVYDKALNGITPALIKSLLLDSTGPAPGEASALMVLMGAVFLISRGIMKWRIPLAFMGTVAITAFVFCKAAGIPLAGACALATVFSGGTLFYALFMAADIITTPVTAAGMLAFGMGCGLFSFLIRFLAGWPEGVSYSILLMNGAVPLIDRYMRPRVFGA